MGKVDFQFDYIRDYYGIAITKGMHVTNAKGERGVIVGAGNYVKVQIEGQKGKANYHPEALAYPSLDYVGKEIKEAQARRLVVESPDSKGGAR